MVPGVAQISVFLPARVGEAERQLMVNVDTQRPGDLTISCWVRYQGELAYHCWPGPHVEEDFLEPLEAAMLVAGTTEVASGCLGESMDATLGLHVLQTLALVLDWVANGYSETRDAPVAA